MIIGIVGLKGSGKSTSADFLVESFDMKKATFAGPLKRAAIALFNLSEDDVYTQEGKKKKVFINSKFSSKGVMRAICEFAAITESEYINNAYVDFLDLTAHEVGLKFVKHTLPLFRGEMTVRQILQVLGTEGGRDVFGDNLWIDNLKKRVGAAGSVVIEDCRFVNEADVIHELSGYTIGCRS